jgi:hypothetical protein
VAMMNLLNLVDVQQVCTITDASHIAVLKNNNIKYLIDVRDGSKKILLNSIESYTLKHRLLKDYILFPNTILTKNKNFIYVNVIPKNELSLFLDKYYYNKKAMIHNVNYLIGTPGPDQKLVMQINQGYDIQYMKIGNRNTFDLMENEFNTIKDIDTIPKLFEVPEVIDQDKINDKIMIIYKEFKGKKVKAEINESIYHVYMNISNLKEKKEFNGLLYEFSHGDFAPWNMKTIDNKYLLYDWEYAGYRFMGYDLIHFIFQIETLLNKKREEDAMKIALNYACNKIEGLKAIDVDIITNLYKHGKSNFVLITNYDKGKIPFV